MFSILREIFPIHFTMSAITAAIEKLRSELNLSFGECAAKFKKFQLENKDKKYTPDEIAEFIIIDSYLIPDDISNITVPSQIEIVHENSSITIEKIPQEDIVVDLSSKRKIPDDNQVVSAVKKAKTEYNVPIEKPLQTFTSVYNFTPKVVPQLVKEIKSNEEIILDDDDLVFQPLNPSPRAEKAMPPPPPPQSKQINSPPGYDCLRHFITHQSIPLKIANVWEVIMGRYHDPAKVGTAHYTTCNRSWPHYHYLVKIDPAYESKIKVSKQSYFAELTLKKYQKYNFYTKDWMSKSINNTAHYENLVAYLDAYEKLDIVNVPATDLEFLRNIPTGDEPHPSKF